MRKTGKIHLYYMNKIKSYLVLLLNISLILIGLIYSHKNGFKIDKYNNKIHYSSELQSSGGDDHDIFYFNTFLNFILLVITVINIITLNIFKRKYYYSIFAAPTLLFLELFVIYLISLDIDLNYSIQNGDYLLLLWMIVYLLLLLYSLILIVHHILTLIKLYLKPTSHKRCLK